MNFKDIFEQWENSRNGGKKKKKESSMDKKWLDRHPPSKEDISEKNSTDNPPTAQSRDYWNKLEAQDEIDIHEKNQEEAKKAIEQLIAIMQRKGFRKGRIIHGKGNHSLEGKSILGPMVREYMEKSEKVGPFGSEDKKNGGKGATWFLLKEG